MRSSIPPEQFKGRQFAAEWNSTAFLAIVRHCRQCRRWQFNINYYRLFFMNIQFQRRNYNLCEQESSEEWTHEQTNEPTIPKWCDGSNDKQWHNEQELNNNCIYILSSSFSTTNFFQSIWIIIFLLYVCVYVYEYTCISQCVFVLCSFRTRFFPNEIVSFVELNNELK